ncbi:DUF6176 family protein [Pseudonocardia sp. KRD291]|uniref:DUF6176 family protein n=1 Tax=Pseudonocardia sp. KRD291 TaxID=2792007 RepID=UPI001C49EDBA|nr:DUF6176 family protein [Pseudonocardia sp. KRD291]MBW0101631.1 hypothetical protein [Pseudonocardia sp. KRD291]
MSTERPRSIPEGLVVELSRSKILPGKEREADRWMAMINERYDECIESLDRERMAVECAFRFREEGPEYIYWMSIYGEDGSGLDLTNPLDRDLQDQATLCKEPGWADAEPQFLLLPEPVKRALLAWALRQAPGSTTSAPPSKG